MSARSRAARIARRATFWLAAGVALLVSHDAVFLAQVGPGQALTSALRDAGHAYWGLASALLLLGGATGLAIWLARIRALRRLAGDAPSTQRVPGTWRRRALGHWIRQFVLVAVAFALQENVEHTLSHGHGIGLGALLGPEYPLALPVIALVTGLAAALTAVVRQHEVALLLRIAAARARLRRPQRAVGLMRPARRRMGHGTPMAVHRALRAPPRVVLHTHI